MRIKYFFLFFFAFQPLCAQDISSRTLKAIYNSLDPASIPQHLAFYELYPQTPEGNLALREAYRLLMGGYTNNMGSPLSLPLSSTAHSMIGLINRQAGDEAGTTLKPEELSSIQRLGARLHNRKLPGCRATSEQEVLGLAPDQIDLARAVLLSQLGNARETMNRVQSYEASLDLMALQVLTKVSLNDPPQAKVRELNKFIFEELGFRFPPHSTYAKDIDLYTFLPSVLDSRRGVCLGVSILYICLAQRLGLNLEIVTPPGHIFVRWKQGNETINIETTARGIHLPDEEYLGVDTRSLQQRNIKQTVGMAHFNQASVFLEKEEYEKALASYSKALEYLPEDKHVMALMGYTFLLNGEENKGRDLLGKVADWLPDYAVSKDTIAEDYLNGNAGIEGIQAMFLHVDETRGSLLRKKDALEAALKKTPLFREGIFSLAGTWLQLHRMGEALETLEKYHQLDSENPSAEYYLAVLYAETMDYKKAWKHLRNAERITSSRQHYPEALNEFRKLLSEKYPE